MGSLFSACGGEKSRTAPVECTTRIGTSANDQETVQTALIEAVPGDVLCFDDGTYRFTDELSISVANVKVRGTFGGAIFDFADQVVGANGLSATGDGFTLQDLTVQDTPGDGVRVTGAADVSFLGVTVRWTAGSVTGNGAYGLYPVSCTNVLIDDCEVTGASDAGIYVGQSSNIIVRNSRAHGNVAGVEIENSTTAEVHGNRSWDNTGGILVFNLPELPVKGDHVLVHDNVIEENNRANFAPAGTIVANVPAGTGLMIMSKDFVEARNNTIRNNVSTGALVISFLALDTPYTDPAYDPYTETSWIHDNEFSGNGTDPQGQLDAVAAGIGAATLEDILWDGFIDSAKVNTNGALTFCLSNNGTATFRDVDFPGGFANTSTDIGPHTCTHDALPGVTF